ncbi:MAG: MXAN_5187 C-terminal domain-containing protein [Pseudomonadota bacterium]
MALTDKKAIEKDIIRLEEAIGGLKISYEKYFIGLEFREPLEERDRIEREFRRIDNIYFQSTSLKFKLRMIKAKYLTFKTHWDKIQKQILDGTYKRELFRQKQQEQALLEEKRRSREGYNVRDKKHAMKLYNDIVNHRLAKGQNIDNLDFVKFDQALRHKVIDLEKKFKNQGVKYNVHVEDGKLKIQVKKRQ